MRIQDHVERFQGLAGISTGAVKRLARPSFQLIQIALRQLPHGSMCSGSLLELLDERGLRSLALIHCLLQRRNCILATRYLLLQPAHLCFCPFPLHLPPLVCLLGLRGSGCHGLQLLLHQGQLLLQPRPLF